MNLLREGLDLPEVAPIASSMPIRKASPVPRLPSSRPSGRAARNVRGQVGSRMPTSSRESMRRAIAETERRRAKQTAHNKLHGITPDHHQEDHRP